MRQMVVVSLFVLLLCGVSLVEAQKGTDTSAANVVSAALSQVKSVEPDAEGPLHDWLRGETNIINERNPGVIVLHPADGAVLDADEDIIVVVDIANWQVVPEIALPASEFAAGFREYNRGHTHTWVYSMDTGERVRFTGAAGLQPIGEGGCGCGCGIHVGSAFRLPPGSYKMYVSLQNHDHTGATQANAQALQAFDAVAFTVE